MAKFGNTGTNVFIYLKGKIGDKCVKHMSANMAKSGVVSVSLDLLGSPDVILSKFNDLPDFVEINRISQNGALTSISFVDKSQDVAGLKVQISAIFKSVAKSVIDLYTSGVLTQDIVPASNDPDAYVFIKECDSIYEDNGWTVSEIFRKLAIDISFPSTWNYHVTQLVVTAGLPVLTLIQNLFPFPALVVKRIGNTLYVDVPKNSKQQQLSDIISCSVVSVSKNKTQLQLSVEGDLGRLKSLRNCNKTEVDGETSEHIELEGNHLCGCSDRGNTVHKKNITVICNKLGGIFGIKQLVYTEDQLQLPTEIWNTTYNSKDNKGIL